jgi:hypothetical protein
VNFCLVDGVRPVYDRGVAKTREAIELRGVRGEGNEGGGKRGQ